MMHPMTRASRAVAWILVLVAAADAALFALRAASLVEDGELAATTGVEEPSIALVWRARQGLPVYAPADGAASIPLYNWLFYRTFAAAASALPDGPASILLVGRWLDALFLAAGALAHHALIRRVLESSGRTLPLAATAALVIVAWFGSSLVRWYALTVRPDGAATACATLGLLVFGTASARTRSLVLSSLLFFAAWSFKQSSVLLLGGCVLHAVLERRFLALLALLGPFAALAATTRLVLGADWATCTLLAPALSPPDPAHALVVAGRALLPGALFWLVPLVDVIRTRAEPGGIELRWLRRSAAVALGGAMLLSLKQGSYVYYYWEAFVALSTLTAVALARGSAGRGGVALAAVLLVVSGAQLAAPGRWSRVDLLSDEAAATRRERIAFVETLPAPFFSEDRLLALPWYAPGGDVYVMDPVLYRAPGVSELVGDGIAGRIRARSFASVLVTPQDRFGLAEAARGAGMVEASVPACLEGFRLWVRPPGPGG
jgi:hypothetical protein